MLQDISRNWIQSIVKNLWSITQRTAVVKICHQTFQLLSEMFKILTISIMTALSNSRQILKHDIFMPKVVPKKDEVYLCTPVRLDHISFYIVGFEPKAHKHTAHHMLLYGCKIPGSSNVVWDCGKMASDGDESGSPCRDEPQVIYSWGLDAPRLLLPDDVGFKIGGDSPIRYLVLQVHYAHKFKKGAADTSGVTLHYTLRKVPKTAGVLVLGTGGELKPLSQVDMETACAIEEDKELHPFAFRTHTHKLGEAVSGWKVVNNAGLCQWKLIGKRNPQEPQMFYHVEEPVVFRKGDIVAARCSMYNSRNETVFIGATSKDEMCNFYIMYWTLDDEPLKQKYCFSDGPPKYSWKNGLPALNNIPEKEASAREVGLRRVAETARELMSRSTASTENGDTAPKFRRSFFSLMLSLWLFGGEFLG